MTQRGHEVLSQFISIHASLLTESQLITKFASSSRRYAENYFRLSREKSSPWIKNLKYDKRTEINMALVLGAYFAPGLNEIKSSLWYYYTSDDFMYLAPYLEPKDFFSLNDFLSIKNFIKMRLPRTTQTEKDFGLRSMSTKLV